MKVKVREKEEEEEREKEKEKEEEEEIKEIKDTSMKEISSYPWEIHHVMHRFLKTVTANVSPETSIGHFWRQKSGLIPRD